MFFWNNVAEGPVTSETIQITTLDFWAGTDTRNYGFSADNVCNASDTYPNNFTGTSFSISTETNNGKYMCFRAVDNLWNTSYLASAFPLNIDTTPNGISFSDNVAVGPVTSDTITIVATGENPGTVYEYSFSNTNAVCNAWDFNGTVYTYVDGTPFTISDETHNGLYICARITDGNNKKYVKSANVLNLSVPPVITINDNVAAGPVQSDTLNVTITDANLSTATYWFSSDAVCNGSDTYGNSFTSWTNFTINTETNNGKYLCFKATDLSGNTTYQVSANPLKIDITAPVITLAGLPTVTLPLGSSYTDAGAEATDNIDGDLTSSIVVVNPVNTAIVWDYTITFNVSDAAGNAATQVTRLVKIVDVTAPVINLNGSGTLTVEWGSVYTDAGAIASDNYDAATPVTAVGLVNTSATGSYTLTYNHTDAGGNAAAEVTRIVNVVDTTKPLITLVGSGTIVHQVWTAYTDAWASFSDAIDGTGSVTWSGLVDGMTVADYTLTYNHTDRSGNSAIQATRLVRVVDTWAPVIQLNGSGSITVEWGSVYTDAGAIAEDNYDADIAVVWSGTVNTAMVWDYTLTYDHRDSHGNAATQVTRTVHVVDTTKPVITLVWSDPVTVEVWDTYNELWATWSDNIDISGNATASGVVNTATVGAYTVYYNHTDNHGNAANQVTRTVNVVDTTKPVITLTGDSTVNIHTGDTYTDAGATANDNYDGDITSSIVTSGLPINTSSTGSYTVTYNVTDAHANTALQVTRTVNVSDDDMPVITLSGIGDITLEVHTSYTDAGATASDNVDGDITSRIETTGGVDVDVVGDYTFTYNVSDTAGNAGLPVTRTIHIVDTTDPVITLNGTATGTVLKLSTYTDAGATANDNYDGDISEDIEVTWTIDTSVLWDQVLTYDVTDAHDNTATTVTRTVTVVTGATPVITLNGSGSVEVEVFTAYTDAGAAASDTEQWDMTSSIVTDNPVNTEMLWEYTLTYDVTDANGNVAERVTRTVRVVDTTPPVITLNGSATVFVTVWSVYEDAGATADDNYDGDLTERVFSKDTVDTWTLGTYTITYYVYDTHENRAEGVTRTVIVQEAVKDTADNNGDGGGGGNPKPKKNTESNNSNGNENNGNNGNETSGNNGNETSGNTLSTVTEEDFDVGAGEEEIPLENTDSGSLDTNSGSVDTQKVCGVAYTGGFDDIETSFAKPYVEKLALYGMLDGEDKMFRPQDNITRAEFLKILLREDCIDYSNADAGTLHFSDIQKDTWVAKVVEKSVSLGIANGYDNGEFRPNNGISRIEAVKFLVKYHEFADDGEKHPFTDVDVAWMNNYLNIAYSNGMVEWVKVGEEMKFFPNNSMTRAEAAKMLWKAYTPKP